MRRQALKVSRAAQRAHLFQVLKLVQIPVTKDVCVFCLARMQFASVHALRRPQRRLLSSTPALCRPPADEITRKKEEGVQESDSAWRPQPPRSFGGGWARTRTAAPSDLTPEEKALRNVLQKESIRESPVSKNASSQDEDAASQGRLFRTVAASPRVPYGQTEFSRDLRLPSRTTRTNGRLSQYATAEVSQMAPTGESVERNNGSRTLESRPITPMPTKPVTHIPQRPRFGGWAKSDTSIELTPDEKALRQTLQQEAAPEPPLPVHRISNSPQTSSVPGYPSRPDPQPNDTVSVENPRTSPTQASSTQRQGPHENENQSRLSDYRQTRDAQLDHHISQSRVKPASRQGDWYCTSCKQNNHPQHRKCPNCQTDRTVLLNWQCEECGQSNPPRHSFCGGCRTSGRSSVAQNQPVDAKTWKHVRRLGPDTSSEHPGSEQIVTPQPSGDTQELARGKAIEQEKIERMERTKGGDFVGLRGQYETPSSRAMNASYWSLETDGSQVADSGSNTANTPETSSTDSVLVNWRAQSTKKPQVHEAQGTGDKRSGQEVADQVLEDRPRTGKLTGGWKRWEPSAARGQLPLTESSLPGPSNQNDASSYPLTTEPDRGQNAKEIDFSSRKRERRVHEPLEQGIAKQLIYNTPMPYAGRSDRDQNRRSKRVVSAYDDVDEEEDRAARRLERKEQRKKAKATKKALAPPTPIYLPEFISVSNLAGVLRVRVEDFIQKMKDLGFEETNNDHILDAETAGLVATEFNFEPIFEQADNPDLLPRPPAEDKSLLPPRPPVVTIMGHVDHGKTTLLDYLRKSSVAASEHGGITQHIGAFSVPMPGGRLVTFLDTPGHEAFLSMRQRGANVTDIVILVVAADDSVKPQTVEAIRHAQTAKVPMIVAVNKIDKEDSNVERVKQDLARYGVEIEDYGGDTQVVCVSGKTGQGMEELEDAAVALADILDMRSETDGQAEGWVLEATTKKAGRVATVLVRRGTLRPGDIIVAGTSWARVRSLRNEAGVMLASAGPGTPVEIDGWREQPAAGDEVLQAPDEQRAKAVISHRLEVYERTQMATDMTAVNEARRLEQEKREQAERAAELAKDTPDTTIAAGAEEQNTPSTPSFQEVFFIIKADVSGSVEAVTNAVSALGNSEVRPHILRTGVGPVTEFDIDHAAVANGHIISFNTTVDGNIQRAAEAQKVKILDQSIIYRLVDDVKAKLSETLPDIVTQKVLGEAEIAQVFEINTKGRVTVPVAGCRVRNGVIGRTGKVRVLRGKEVVYDGMMIGDLFVIMMQSC